ncbi:MAG: hypothetical protein PHY92_00025 [Alphaproteobacteria bacterium]|nr:hypothetical protein [Alphaproteobacteria bacterium]
MMNKTKAAALVAAAVLHACPALAQNTVTPVAPIYPTQDQQTGQRWGTTLLVACPDGYQLSFDPPPPAGIYAEQQQQTGPTCVPMAALQPAGSAHE